MIKLSIVYIICRAPFGKGQSKHCKSQFDWPLTIYSLQLQKNPLLVLVAKAKLALKKRTLAPNHMICRQKYFHVSWKIIFHTLHCLKEHCEHFNTIYIMRRPRHIRLNRKGRKGRLYYDSKAARFMIGKINDN